MKKTIALLLTLVMLLTLAACGGAKNSGEDETGNDAPGGGTAALSADTAVGDKVELGRLDGETLAWTAVAKGVGTLLLVSDKVLLKRSFNDEENRFAAWKDSTVRAYLNGEFFTSVFSAEEQALIAPTAVTTENFDGDAYETKIVETEDRVFLPGRTEFALYIAPMGDFRYGAPTQKLLDENIYMAEVTNSATVEKACGWLLRDDGEQTTSNCLTIEGFDGSVSGYGSNKTDPGGVRPAMWVYTDKALADGWKAGTAELPADASLDAKIAGLKVGDTVEFGRAVVVRPATEAKVVTWKVLDETDDALLLFCDQLLGAYRFGEQGDESLNWSNSELRAYMNGDEFIDSFLNPWERAKVRLTHVVTCDGDANWDVDPGPETDDYLFPLDLEELLKYLPDEANRGVADTEYWLRSPNFVKGWFSYVTGFGAIDQNDGGHYYGIRPAMWISK